MRLHMVVSRNIHHGSIRYPSSSRSRVKPHFGPVAAWHVASCSALADLLQAFAPYDNSFLLHRDAAARAHEDFEYSFRRGGRA